MGRPNEESNMVDEIEYVIRNGMGRAKKQYTSKGKLHKCLTNGGFAAVASLILLDNPGTITAFDYLAIGTGTITADPTDTTLGTEIKRKAGTGTRMTTTVTNDTAKLTATFSSADGLSGTSEVSEVGMFNDVTTGTMLMRQTFTPESLDWDAGDTFEITVKIQLKQGT